MLGHKLDLKTAISVFAAASLCAVLLSGCKGKAVNPGLTYEYSKSSPIFAFCESLRKSIENSPQNLVVYDWGKYRAEKIQKETLPDLEAFMSNLDVPFDYLDWAVVDPADRLNAYIVTYPLQRESYNRDGKIRHVSNVNVQKYIDQFGAYPVSYCP